MAWTSKLLLIACVCMIVAGVSVVYDLNGNSMDFSNRQMVLVVSDSMDGEEDRYDVDSFQANTLVMIEHVPDNEVRFLRVGQVLSYYDGSTLIHHRIIQVNDDSFYVKGDNGHSTDKVMFGDVNGVVVGTNSWIGSILSWFSNNFLLFLGAMFALSIVLILCYVRSTRPEREVS